MQRRQNSDETSWVVNYKVSLVFERNFHNVSKKKDHNAQSTWAFAILEQLYCCKQRDATEIEVMNLD